MLIVRQKTKKELILGKLILLNSKKKKNPQDNKQNSLHYKSKF